MRSTAAALSLFGALALALGCSSDPAADGIVSDATIVAVSAAYCAKIPQCYGDTFTKVLGGTAFCTDRVKLELINSKAGPGFQVTEAQAQACKAAVERAPCQKVLADDVPECGFKGALADAAPCASDSQCQSGTCYVPTNEICGRCAAAVAEGGDCVSAKCARGLTCASNKCVRRATEGAACGASQPCETPLACINGKCGKGLASGAACSVASGSTPCDTNSGVYCKPNLPSNDGVCTPFTLASAGQACGIKTQPTVDYAVCTQSDCVGATQTAQGTCQAQLADGAACDTSKPPGCQLGAKCRAGKCKVLDASTCR